MTPTNLPRIKQENIEITNFDLITVNLFGIDGETLAVLEFDRLVDPKAKITFTARGSTTICDV